MCTCLEEDVSAGLAGAVAVAGGDVDRVRLSARQPGQGAAGVRRLTRPHIPGGARGRQQEGGGHD